MNFYIVICFIFIIVHFTTGVRGHGGEEDESEMDHGVESTKMPGPVSTLVDDKHLLLPPVVIVISFDGFRHDYLHRLKKLKQDSSIWRLINDDNGVYDDDGMQTSFATITFPNHYTAVTGLYQESHGIVANSVYDPDTKKSHALKKNLPEQKYLYGGEPMWTTVGRQLDKKAAACYMWVGCQNGEFAAENYVPFDSKATWENVTGTIMKWLRKDVRLMNIYWREPDSTGHGKGPDSQDMNITLVEIDDAIETLLANLTQAKLLTNNVHFIFISDHGMATVVGNVTIPIRKDLFNVTIMQTSLWHVEPLDETKTEETVEYFKRFANLEVYKKKDIPEEWHYKNNRRIGSVLVVAKLGYVLLANASENVTLAGEHGNSLSYPEMRGIFVANGRAFRNRKGKKIVDLANVDVYSIVCNILNVKAAPNNGSSSVLSTLLDTKYLKTMKEAAGAASSLLIVALTSTVVVLFVLVTYLLHRASYQNRKQRYANLAKAPNGVGEIGDAFMYRRLPNEQVAPLLSSRTLEHAVDDSDDDSI